MLIERSDDVTLLPLRTDDRAISRHEWWHNLIIVPPYKASRSQKEENASRSAAVKEVERATEGRLERLENKLDALNQKLDTQAEEMNARFMTLERMLKQLLGSR